MSVHRYQVAALADSALAKDKFVNTLYFNHTAPGEILEADLDAVCNDLATVFQTRIYFSGAPREIEVTAYDVAGPPPHFPKGHAIHNEGVVNNSNMPREIALCLSFYGERNLPRTRGRIYLPFCLSGLVASAVRPTTPQMQVGLDLAGDLASIGGIDVDWSVHSATTGATEKVQHAWVDDEWDTVRSRGLDSTTRITAAIGE